MDFNFAAEPLPQFILRYENAVKQGNLEPNAVTLATVNASGQPKARIVYYKEIINNQITFYTNYHGDKAQEILLNPKVCILFFWPKSFEQVQFLGSVQKTSREVSEKYFATRARESQIGAWASDQSKVIKDHDELHQKVLFYEEKFKNQLVPCPPHWGGFSLNADQIEFWFGRSGRLHERFVYEKSKMDWNRIVKSP